MSQNRNGTVDALKCIAVEFNNLAASFHKVQMDAGPDEAKLVHDALAAMKAAVDDHRSPHQCGRNDLIERLQLKLDCIKKKYVLHSSTCIITENSVNSMRADQKEKSFREPQSFSQTIHITRDMLGNESLLSSIMLYNIGLIQKERGALHHAGHFFHFAMNTVADVSGEERMGQFLSFFIFHNMGSTCYLQGRFDESISALSHALECGMALLGHNHVLVASTIREIACVLLCTGHMDEALVAYDELSLLHHEMSIARLSARVASLVDCNEDNIAPAA